MQKLKLQTSKIIIVAFLTLVACQPPKLTNKGSILMSNLRAMSIRL